MTTTAGAFGETLRTWRRHRRYSQLQLAAEASVSQRHLSFLERGRAKPSREMVLHLAGVLDVPLRDRNSLLTSAGFAPVYEQRRLDGEGLAEISAVLQPVLEAHEPYPAIVMDRQWNLVLANGSALRLTGALLAPDGARPPGPVNLVRIGLHPDGLRTVTENWREVAASVLRRLEHQLRERPTDGELLALYDEVTSYQGIADLESPPTDLGVDDLVLAIHYKTEDVELRLFSMLATLGEPTDATVAELVLESFYPMDEASRALLQSWQDEQTPS